MSLKNVLAYSCSGLMEKTSVPGSTGVGTLCVCVCFIRIAKLKVKANIGHVSKRKVKVEGKRFHLLCNKNKRLFVDKKYLPLLYWFEE